MTPLIFSRSDCKRDVFWALLSGDGLTSGYWSFSPLGFHCWHRYGRGSADSVQEGAFLAVRRWLQAVLEGPPEGQQTRLELSSHSFTSQCRTETDVRPGCSPLLIKGPRGVGDESQPRQKACCVPYPSLSIGTRMCAGALGLSVLRRNPSSADLGLV